MPSDLRPTTHECMHLVTRIHIVTFVHVIKDGGYTIRSVRAKNPMLHANLVSLFVTEQELWQIEVLHCGNGDFRSFLLV